jgi:hypothetical protein
LGRPGDAHRQDDESPGQGGPYQRHGDRHLPAGTEELDPNRPGVLHDEVHEGHPEEDGDGDGYPGSADAGAAHALDVSGALLPATSTWVLRRIISGQPLPRSVLRFRGGRFGDGHISVPTHLTAVITERFYRRPSRPPHDLTRHDTKPLMLMCIVGN